MPDPTTNYGWDLPNTGGDSGAWGGLLNTILNDIDTELAATDAVADAALPKAGGTMTGEILHLTDTYTISNLSSIGATLTLDLDVANFFYGTLSANVTTVTFSNVPSNFVAITLEITGGGSAYTITWPSSVKWPGGTPPTFPAGEVNVITMYSRDGGTTWRAASAMEDSS